MLLNYTVMYATKEKCIIHIHWEPGHMCRVRKDFPKEVRSKNE